ncbi:MAG: CPBP family intramembrane metalloprotease [candidate division Zixibacteria bacterium]|nr:CPBP family intramembrane metalloprotease [candidate division Zixibacteria bacterium]
MSNLSDWIKQHQVLAFYLLVFVISWPAMFIAFFLFPRNQALQAPFGLIASFCPVLIALLISAVAKPEPKQARRPIRWLVFICAWFFTWAVMCLHTGYIRGVTLEMQILIPTGLVALLPGWLISCAFSRVPGVKELFGTLLKPKGNIVWYLAALFIVPVVQLIGAGITSLAGGEVSFALSSRSFLDTVIFLGLVFLNGLLVSGGINEETGWRGFVLPRLQARFPVIGAIVIVWFFWALWHIPYDIGLGTPLEGILINRILYNFIWALLFAWVYNRTGGSLLAPVIFHPAMNAFGNNLPGTTAATVLFVLLALAVIFYKRMWKKLPSDHPAVCS